MKRTTLLSISTAALVLGAGSAMAVEQAVIDAIVADLSAQGFTRIEIEVQRNRLDIDAYGGGREGDFYYSLDGVLLSFEVEEDDSYTFAPDGTYIDLDDDDDDEDGDDDDDEDDGDDDDEDDGDDDDEDEEEDDDDDDDEDDDGDDD
jgi:stringent starvation protein B